MNATADSQMTLNFVRHPQAELQKLDQFVAFHLENPAVFDWFERFARERLARRTAGGARAIGEWLRWEVSLEVDREIDEPKISDHWWPYYARLLIARDSRFEHFFHTKQSFPFEPWEVLERVELAQERRAE